MFINWKFQDGKKLPISTTGYTVSPFDTQYHMSSYEQAAAHGRVAMVLGDVSEYFFIDIDHCCNGGVWSPLAVDLCNRFMGCFVEISQSGTGLHIIGCASVGDEYACKYKPDDRTPLECTCGQEKCTCRAFDIYRKKRFVALTMNGFCGKMDCNAQGAMDQLLSDYQFNLSGTAQAADLRDCPVPEYTGKWDIDDIPDVIIQKELNNANKVFGGKASFKQLWEGDEATLSAYYPNDRDGSKMDHNSADLALCTTLCFWTGNNHSAVDYLMRRSGLMRDKWAKRGDYRSTTLKLATCDKVYSYVAPIAESTVELPDIGAPFLTIDMMEEKFKGYVYVAEINRVFDPTNGLLLDQGRFNAVYGGCIYCMDTANQVQNSTAWNIVTKCQVPVIKKASTMGFKPMEVPGINMGEFNAYVPCETEMCEGDVTPFLDHISNLLPNSIDQSILINYMAACVQHKGKKFQWAPVLQGVEGNGKSLVNVVMTKCIGPRYSNLVSGDTFNRNFNGWLMDNLFIGVEEFASSDKFNVLERIKPYITNERIQIEKKGICSFEYDNYANFIFNTNHKDGVRKSINDRRYCVMYTAQQSKSDLQPMSYYRKLWDWARNGGFKIINHYLSTMKIDEKYNPATEIINAPRSSVHDEVIYNSLTNNETAVVEAIEDECIGFRGGIISSQRVKELTNLNGKRIGKILTDLGYKKYCRLSKCLVQENGVKPYLWVKLDNHDNKLEIMDNYIKLNYEVP